MLWSCHFLIIRKYNRNWNMNEEKSYRSISCLLALCPSCLRMLHSLFVFEGGNIGIDDGASSTETSFPRVEMSFLGVDGRAPTASVVEREQYSLTWSNRYLCRSGDRNNKGGSWSALGDQLFFISLKLLPPLSANFFAISMPWLLKSKAKWW